MPGIGAIQPGVAEAGRCEVEVADGVAGLHRGDDVQVPEHRLVPGAQDLGVLDAPAGLGKAAFTGGHGGQGVAVPGQNLGIAPVADGVGGDLDAAAQRVLVERGHVLARRLHQARGVGCVAVGLMQGGAARAESAVDIVFDRPGDDPSVGDAAGARGDQGGGAVGGDRVVDSQRRFPGLGHLLQQGDVGPGRAHEMDPGPAVAGLDPEAGAIGVPLRLGIGLGHQRGEQGHGGVDDEAGRLSLRALGDLSARGGDSRGIDPGGGESGRGGGDGVAVGALQQNDAAGCGGVEVRGGQEACAVGALGPAGLDPAATDDRTVGVGLGPGRQPGHGVDDRGRTLEVQRQLAPADAVEVGMAVGEAGEQGGAIQIDDGQPLDRGRIGGGPDPGDAAVAGDHDLGRRGRVIAGVDGSAPDEQVLGLCGEGQGGEGGGGQEGAEHGVTGLAEIGCRNCGDRAAKVKVWSSGDRPGLQNTVRSVRSIRSVREGVQTPEIGVQIVRRVYSAGGWA